MQIKTERIQINLQDSIIIEMSQWIVRVLLHCLLVNPSAVLPDLPVGARQWCDVTHLDHARHEISEKCALATNVRSDLCIGGSTVEELLVRVQKPLLADKILVVVVLKYGWGLKVQRSQIVVT